jgi:hypothetical protein
VAGSISITEEEEVGAELFQWDSTGARHPFLDFTDSSVEAEPYYIDFHTVACGENGCLFNVREAAQLIDRSWPLCFRDSELFTQFYWSIMYGEANGDDAALLFHGITCRKPKDMIALANNPDQVIWDL